MAVVILTNSSIGADDLGFHILDESIPLKTIRKAVAVSSSILQSYIGTYVVTPEFKLEITVDNNQLHAQATNQPKLGLFAESEKRFFLKEVDAQVEFVSNAEGQIEKLILYQGGKAQQGIRQR